MNAVTFSGPDVALVWVACITGKANAMTATGAGLGFGATKRLRQYPTTNGAPLIG
jgi:hypothetical protein